MKTLNLIVAALLVAGAAAAATVEWSFPTDLALVYYVQADQKGGCALWGLVTNGTVRVLWLDKSGQVIYDQSLASLIIGFTLDKRGIVYSYGSGPTYVTVYVDKKGAETPVSAPGEHTTTAFTSIPGSAVMDRKGFFVFRLPLAPPQVATIVRYKYK